MNLSKREKQDLIDLIVINCEEQDNLMNRISKATKQDQQNIIDRLKNNGSRVVLDFVELLETLKFIYGIKASFDD